MRTMRNAFLYFWLVSLLLMAVNVLALDPSKRITQYQHKMWRVQDGLLPNIPDWVFQTDDGYLLVGGPSIGIFQFDGVRFIPWLFPSAPSRGIIFPLPSKTGGFWFDDPHGITHVKGKSVVAHFDLSGVPASTSEDLDGSLWIAQSYFSGNSGPLCRITDLSVHCFGETEGMPLQLGRAILADGKGGVWIGSDTALVHWKSGQSEIYEYKELKSSAGQIGVGNVVQDSDGSLWVGIDRPGPGLGLEKFDGRSSKPFITRNFDSSKIGVTALRMDRDQNLWVGTWTNGLYRIHGDTVDHFGKTEGLSSDTVTRLYEDREGILWVATSQGLDSFRDINVTTFSHSEGLLLDNVDSVMASRDGTVWLAQSGSLDYIRNGEVFSIRAGAGLPGDQVTSLLEDHTGQIWIGVDDGLFLFKDQHFRRLPEPNHRPLGMVGGITEDIDGNIWAECASKPRKLVRIRDFHVQEEFPESKLPPGHSLASDPNGGIWIATLKGDVGLFRNGALEVKFPLNLGGDPFNRKIMSRADGSILAASENGLVEWRQEKVQRMTTKNGLPCNSVISFMEDNENRWWLHTGCGVLEFPDSELQHWRNNPETIVQTRVFDVLDGARPTGWPSFNTAAYSA